MKRLLSLALAALLITGASLDTRRFERLGHDMMCACGCRQILLECNHVGCPSSEGMRKELVANMQSGKDDKAITQVFVEKYGPTVLASPRTSGFELTAWIMPFAVFAAGILMTLWLARHWQRRPRTVVAATEDPRAQALRERARQETEL